MSGNKYGKESMILHFNKISKVGNHMYDFHSFIDSRLDNLYGKYLVKGKIHKNLYLYTFGN